MKKYIINILLFFAIVVVIDLCVGYVGDYLQSHAKGGPTRETNDLLMIDQHDVLIFGSSRCKNHYDTPYLSDTLGLDFYNAGYDGNGVVLSYGLLSLILQRYQPKLVLLDVEPAFDINVYAGDNNHKRYIRGIKPYYKNAIVSSLIKDVSIEEWYKVHSGMMRYNTEIINKAKDIVRVLPKADHGYIPRVGELSYEPERKDNTSKIQIDEFKLGCIESMIKLAQSKNVPIAIIASPKYGYRSSEELQPAFDICRRNHVPIIDYYAHPMFMQHREWFKESMHLNGNGALEYSKLIVEDLRKLLNNY